MILGMNLVVGRFEKAIGHLSLMYCVDYFYTVKEFCLLCSSLKDVSLCSLSNDIFCILLLFLSYELYYLRF